jgi:hypothetical protein
MVPKDQTLRLAFVVLALGVAGALILAAYQWTQNKSPDTVALIGLAATLGLATAAVLTMEQNRALVAAATKEADATSDTVKLLRDQVEIGNRPWLVIDVTRDATPELTLVVRNVGTGPAIGIRLAAYRFTTQNLFAGNAIAGIAAGASWEVRLILGQPGDQRYRCLTDGVTDELAIAAGYDDWFGVHHRVVGGKPPEQWAGDAHAIEAPGWVSCS